MDERFQKILQMLGGGQANPSMGEVKTQPEERFLNSRPTMTAGYPDQADQDIYNQDKAQNRVMAEKGAFLGNPTPEDVNRDRMIQDFSPMVGEVKVLNKAPRMFKVGEKAFEAKTLEDALKVRNAMEKTGMAPAQSILHDTKVMNNIGRVIDPAESLPTPPADDRDYGKIIQALKDHYSAVKDLQRANPNFDRTKALLNKKMPFNN